MRAVASLQKEIQLNRPNVPNISAGFDATIAATVEVSLFYLIFKSVFGFLIIKIVLW